MIGVEVVNAEGERDAAGLDLLLEEMKDRGFLCGKTGPNRNVLTLMPPLVVDRMQLDLLLHNLQEALTLLEG